MGSRIEPRTEIMTAYSLFWFVFGPAAVFGCVLVLVEGTYLVYGSLGVVFGILASVTAFGIFKQTRWSKRLPLTVSGFHLLFLALEFAPDLLPPDVRGDLPASLTWVAFDLGMAWYFSRNAIAARLVR